jgi:hypothetical protein
MVLVSLDPVECEVARASSEGGCRVKGRDEVEDMGRGLGAEACAHGAPEVMEPGEGAHPRNFRDFHGFTMRGERRADPFDDEGMFAAVFGVCEEAVGVVEFAALSTWRRARQRIGVCHGALAYDEALGRSSQEDAASVFEGETGAARGGTKAGEHRAEVPWNVRADLHASRCDELLGVACS